MITMYVNGDSHTARVYGESGSTATELLAQKYQCTHINHAVPGSSNQRIIRTTIEQLPTLDPQSTLIIIGWTSFERTEWYYNDQWHQICGNFYHHVDPELGTIWQQHLESWWADDNHECWRRQADQHHAIWIFHNILKQLGYHTLFYQGCRTCFFDGCPQQDQNFRLPWHDNTWTHNPYAEFISNQRLFEGFSYYVESKGFQHKDNQAHFGADAHQCWAEYLDPYVKTKLNLIQQKG